MVALMLTFSSTDGRAQDNSSVPPKQTQTPPPASAPRLVVQPQITDLSYYKIICDKPKDHDAADLCEQRRMAQAAEDSVWWARLQTWIGIFGAGGLAITLIFTALATKVASRQVKLSRRALVDTDRAFIFPDAGLLKAILRATDDKVQAWKTSVRWKNSGNTPTRYLHMYINKEIRADLLPPDFGFPDYGDGITTQSMIAPKAELESAELEITLEEMEAVSDGKKHLYVWGWAEYDDVFESTPRHRTEFCYKWTIGGNVRDPNRFSSRYNVHDRHNGADEECEFPLKTVSSRDVRGRI